LQTPTAVPAFTARIVMNIMVPGNQSPLRRFAIPRASRMGAGFATWETLARADLVRLNTLRPARRHVPDLAARCSGLILAGFGTFRAGCRAKGGVGEIPHIRHASNREPGGSGRLGPNQRRCNHANAVRCAGSVSGIGAGLTVRSQKKRPRRVMRSQ